MVDLNDPDNIVFSESQIAKGIRPLAQHGTVVVGTDRQLYLFGTKGDLIASAPLEKVTAKRGVWPWRNMVFLNLAGQKLNCTPGWGENRFNGAIGALSTKAAKALVEAIASGGQRTAM